MKDTVLRACDLQVLLHYFYMSGQCHTVAKTTGAEEALIKLGLLMKSEPSPVVTDKGCVYVEAVLRTPLPVQVWKVVP